MFGLSPGDLPTWVATVIAFLALGVAAIGVLISGLAAFLPAWFYFGERKDRQDAEEARDRAEQARNAALESYQRQELERLEAREARDRQAELEAQARLIHVWLTRGPRPAVGSAYFPATDFSLVFSNASQAPAYRVWVWVKSSFVDRGSDGLKDHFELTDIVRRLGRVHIECLPPTGLMEHRVSFGEVRFAPALPPGSNLHLVNAEIESVDFWDANQQPWERKPGEKLSGLTEDSIARFDVFKARSKLPAETRDSTQDEPA